MGPPRNASMVVTSREGSPVGLINGELCTCSEMSKEY